MIQKLNNNKNKSKLLRKTIFLKINKMKQFKMLKVMIPNNKHRIII